LIHPISPISREVSPTLSYAQTVPANPPSRDQIHQSIRNLRRELAKSREWILESEERVAMLQNTIDEIQRLGQQPAPERKFAR
jgi:hypothetical protein